MTLVCCVGTGTDVGKTWVGAAVLADLRGRGLRVAARKPVQSFDPAAGLPTDADVLAAATGERVEDVCPADGWFEVAMAPPMAAAVLGRQCPTVAGLAARVGATVAGCDLVWVEGAGGLRSPMAADGDGLDLCRLLRPDAVVLVADPGLGTINSVRLTLDALAGVAGDTVVVLNRFDGGDPLHVRNRDWLVERDRRQVVTDTGTLAERLVTRARTGGTRPSAG